MLQPFPIPSPIAVLVNMTIAPRLVLQAVCLIGVYRDRILVPSAAGRHRFAALAALLLESRTVTTPVALLMRAIIAPGLIL